MSMDQVTTADAIGRFRRELLENGFNVDEAFTLSRDALNALLHGEDVIVAGKAEVSK